MSAEVRVGIVGRGFGDRVVAPVFAATEACAVVDVVSPRDEMAVRALCARRDVDLIAVHSPPFLHREHVGWAIDAGHAVLCDKPFGRDLADAEVMLARAEAAGVVHLLNFEFRCHPGRAALRALVLDGTVGTPEHVLWTQYSAGSRHPLRSFGWLFDASLGGGWIGAWGSHAIDFLRWTFGEVDTAAAVRRTTVAVRPDADGHPQPCTAEDGFTATLRTQAGVSVTIDTTFVAPTNQPGRIVVLGSAGVLESTGDHRIVVRTDAVSREAFVLAPEPGDPHLVPMRRWAEAVRDAVRGDGAGPDVPTFRDGVACARVMDALRA